MSDHGQIDLPNYIGGQLLRFVRRRLRRRGRTLGQLLLPQWTRTSDGEVDRYEIGWLLYIRMRKAMREHERSDRRDEPFRFETRSAIRGQLYELDFGAYSYCTAVARRWERFVTVRCRQKRADGEHFARTIYHVRVGVRESKDHADFTAAIEAEAFEFDSIDT